MHSEGESSARRVYGWREWVLFEGRNNYLRAKLDTGARTSTIHAEEVQLFERAGADWVRFVVVDPQRDGHEAEPVAYECPVERVARVRNADGHTSERVVVTLVFWVGGDQACAEFTLNSRHGMLNPVLLGRKAIRKLGLVDSRRSFLMGHDPKVHPDAMVTGDTHDDQSDDEEDV